MPNKHQIQPSTVVVTSDGLRRLQLGLEAQITAAGASGVTSWNTRTGAVTLVALDVTTALGYTPTSVNGLTGIQTVAAFKTGLTLVKADVGLGSVDNTADAAKPVSTAAQAALDAKQPLDQQLTDVAALVYAGNAGKVVKVNAGATAFELATDLSGGAGSYSISTKTAAYTEAATSGEVIALLELAAGFTVTLPTAVGNTAKLVYKKMLAAGSMVIDGATTETIDGGLTATLTNQYESITLVSNNANWVII